MKAFTYGAMSALGLATTEHYISIGVTLHMTPYNMGTWMQNVNLT